MYTWSFIDGSQVAFGAKMHSKPILCSAHVASANRCELRLLTGDAEGIVKIWFVSFLTKSFVISASISAHTGSVMSLIMDQELGCLYVRLNITTGLSLCLATGTP
jgi:hypothetical protein